MTAAWGQLLVSLLRWDHRLQLGRRTGKRKTLSPLSLNRKKWKTQFQSSVRDGRRLLHVNSQRLVDELQGLTLLDGRYSDIHLVNMPGGLKRGHFSLVFKAHDKIEDKPVAIKFFDQDPTKMDAFRLSCFDREHSLLTELLGASRCLQVLSPIAVFNFDIGPPNQPFIVSAKYFVTEWHDGDIDEFFFRHEPERAIHKLKAFNEVVLAIEALHNRRIFHRDVKVDNFRREKRTTLDRVVAIDLGTAAMETSGPLLTTYAGPVGLLTYSAPEAFCGLAGDRDIAFLSDIYALGCMLFELFAEDDFGTAYRSSNPDFENRLAALRYTLAHLTGDELLREWDKNAHRLLGGLTALEFPKDGASVPLAVTDIINDLIKRMTIPDFRHRTITLDQVRRRLWSAIRCLENIEVSRRRAERIAAIREKKRENARLRGLRAVSRPQRQLGHAHGRS